ncbi:MAG: hypothetical protein WED07_15855 [Candidatus Freyarchaeum deiterrae]
MIDKSELFKYIDDRKALVSKIESLTNQCELDNLLQSIECFHDLSSKIRSLNIDCLSLHLITQDDYYRIRNETNEMYSQIKSIVDRSLREKCKVEWVAF